MAIQSLHQQNRKVETNARSALLLSKSADLVGIERKRKRKSYPCSLMQRWRATYIVIVIVSYIVRGLRVSDLGRHPYPKTWCPTLVRSPEVMIWTPPCKQMSTLVRPFATLTRVQLALIHLILSLPLLRTLSIYNSAKLIKHIAHSARDLLAWLHNYSTIFLLSGEWIWLEISVEKALVWVYEMQILLVATLSAFSKWTFAKAFERLKNNDHNGNQHILVYCGMVWCDNIHGT